jgi:hypothetical protein
MLTGLYGCGSTFTCSVHKAGHILNKFNSLKLRLLSTNKMKGSCILLDNKLMRFKFCELFSILEFTICSIWSSLCQ